MEEEKQGDIQKEKKVDEKSDGSNGMAEEPEEKKTSEIE